jgi:cation diffusion facilitator family transporter
MSTRGSSKRSVLITLAIVSVQAVLLGVLATVTGSATLLAEMLFSVADIGVELFLLIGLTRSVRPADESHPLGYGREAFFWSLFAATGLFLGGGVASLVQGVHALGESGHEETAGYLLGYLVVVAITVSDAWALAVSWRMLQAQAKASGLTPWRELLGTTDPAAATVFTGNLAAVASGPVAIAGLALHQATGNGVFDALGSIGIGVTLMAASVLLLRMNMDLIASPSVSPQLRDTINAQLAATNGIIEVRDLAAVITGPRQVLVAAQAAFDPRLDLPGVERAIAAAEHALTRSGPVRTVFITPAAGFAPAGPGKTADGTGLT